MPGNTDAFHAPTLQRAALRAMCHAGAAATDLIPVPQFFRREQSDPCQSIIERQKHLMHTRLRKKSQNAFQARTKRLIAFTDPIAENTNGNLKHFNSPRVKFTLLL